MEPVTRHSCLLKEWKCLGLFLLWLLLTTDEISNQNESLLGQQETGIYQCLWYP
jgi:hypothetical protein